MNVESLGLKAFLHIPAQENPASLNWIEVEETVLVLESSRNIPKGTEAQLRFDAPKEWEIDHVTKELTLPVTVERSDDKGLFLCVDSLNSVQEKHWNDWLALIDDKLGVLSRVYPRIEVPELEIQVRFPEKPGLDGVLFDISDGGMCVLGPEIASPGTDIAFEIVLPASLRKKDETLPSCISAIGIIKNHYLHGTGIEFRSGESNQAEIRGLLQDLTRYRSRQLIYPRYDVLDLGIQATLCLPGEEAVGVQLKNMSVSGAHLLTEKVPRPEDLLTLKILANDRFKNLREPLETSGRIVRTSPGGVVIHFTQVSNETQERLAAWMKEIAMQLSSHSALSLSVEKPEHQTTLVIAHEAELIAIRDYLYNLSPRGLFLPTTKRLSQGDVVRFVVNLGRTNASKKPFVAFQGEVVHLSRKGISVQFYEPETVREQIEAVFNRSQTTKGKIGQPRNLTFNFLSPGSILMMSATIVIVGLIWVLSEMNQVSPVNQVRSRLGREKKGIGDTQEQVGLKVAGVTYIVDPTRIRDVILDDQKRIMVVLDDGRTVPGAALIHHLSPELKSKLRNLLEAIRRERVAKKVKRR